MPRIQYVLSYSYVVDILERRGPFRADHLALIQQWNSTGRLPLAGALGDPPHGGLLVFDVDDPAVIQQFLDADPYAVNGLVASHRIDPLTVVTP